MTRICHLPLYELAFLWLHFQAHFPETTEHLAQSGRMPFGSLTEYDNVVQASQGRLHEPLKDGRRVAQSKRQHLELVHTIRGGEWWSFPGPVPSPPSASSRLPGRESKTVSRLPTASAPKGSSC
ncbi:hypothetical protein T05_15729 [Trichinella murrelli]|uniref:Uncharacterized protein n=1 Tax=Trichinella murrelli TaxID=144512 RepID=A0A0V0U473_9BILA|nr:hypothetical protein T05_15729 [Trichinella murrelli]